MSHRGGSSAAKQSRQKAEPSSGRGQPYGHGTRPYEENGLTKERLIWIPCVHMSKKTYASAHAVSQPPPQLGPNGGNDDEERRFMILTETAFRKQDYNQSSAAFSAHLSSLLGEARDSRAVIDMPGPHGAATCERFHGNRFAGEVVQRIHDDCEWRAECFDRLVKKRKAEEDEAREVKKSKEEMETTLGIPSPHMLSLMSKGLHQRYRTIWKMATNRRIIPAKRTEYSDQQDKKPTAKFPIDLFQYGGFPLHKERYDLCTALAHAGSLRDDLVVATSSYFDVWHESEPKRKLLYQTMFIELYGFDYDTAEWLITAADKHGVVKAREWIQLIERFLYAVDNSIHSPNLDLTDTLKRRQAISQYNAWIAQVVNLVRKRRALGDDRRVYAKLQLSEDLNQATTKFCKEAKGLLAASWDRPHDIPPWKPTLTLQKPLEFLRADKHDPFGPPDPPAKP